MVNRTECDEDDAREFAMDLDHTTCQACRDAYEARAADWHAELRQRLRTEPPPIAGAEEEFDETPPTQPGQKRG